MPSTPWLPAILSSLKRIAEGAEDERHVAILRTHHLDEEQDPYFSRPASPESVVQVLNGGSAEAMAPPGGSP